MLKGMVAFVSGGAGSLGLATVKRLVSEGMKVVLFDLPTSKGQQQQLNLGENVLFAAGDIRYEKDVKDAMALVREKYGRLDVIVNCAGTYLAKTIFNYNKKKTLDPSLISEYVQVNLIGTVSVIKEGLELMTDKNADEDGLKGIVINTSGFSATDGQKGQILMSAIWGGISSMTLPLCRELSDFGVRAVTISPGLMKSSVTEIMPKKVLSHLTSAVPSLKRTGNCDEYAHLVSFIIENRYINGTVIQLDGGLRFNLM